MPILTRQYNSERLTKILTNVTDMIGATVLNISSQDYEPQGASVTILIAEEFHDSRGSRQRLAHLDKSHVTVHTYPEYHPDTCLATFRVDIDVATCGEITPLSTLDYLIGSFDSDIITMDYRVRGFTRDVSGRKLFMDHQITSIQDYIDSGHPAAGMMRWISMYMKQIFSIQRCLSRKLICRITCLTVMCMSCRRRSDWKLWITSGGK